METQTIVDRINQLYRPRKCPRVTPPRSDQRASLHPGEESGMNLIEIMVVVAIIGLLMGTVSVVAFSRYKKAQISTTERVIKNVETAIQTFMMDNNGGCPTNLSQLFQQGILNKDPVDSWGQPLVYKCPGERNREGVDLVSKGPDKKEGTADDLKN